MKNVFSEGKCLSDLFFQYLRRIFRKNQMDFEFAIWQAVYLLVNPQKVYRNFHYRKETKDQYARDDPAFLVLLAIFLSFTSGATL